MIEATLDSKLNEAKQAQGEWQDNILVAGVIIVLVLFLRLRGVRTSCQKAGKFGDMVV